MTRVMQVACVPHIYILFARNRQHFPLLYYLHKYGTSTSRQWPLGRSANSCHYWSTSGTTDGITVVECAPVASTCVGSDHVGIAKHAKGTQERCFI
jgi:hypothetical protein